jgi:hypothetical protein
MVVQLNCSIIYSRDPLIRQLLFCTAKYLVYSYSNKKKKHKHQIFLMFAKDSPMQFYIWLILNQNVITFNEVGNRIMNFAKKKNHT